MPTVTFRPSGAAVAVPAGTTLLEACRRAGAALPSPCGGKGLCGKCRVRVLRGAAPADSRQEACVPRDLLSQGWRAACLVQVDADLTVADPVGAEAVVVTDFLSRAPRGDSDWWERDIRLPPPSATDARDDRTRLTDALARSAPDLLHAPAIDFHVLHSLPAALRRGDFHCRVAGFDATVTRVLAAGTEPRRLLGLAADIGTTTLAVALCDMERGDILGIASGTNPQNAYGDDVVSRMEYAARGDAELATMRSVLARALTGLAREAGARATIDDEPAFLVIAANTVMSHLALGVPTDALAVSPFVPAFLGSVLTRADALGLSDAAAPFVHVLPGIGGYVGGDVVAGLLAHDVHRLDGVTLYLDVGTNGEIVLAHSGKLLVCATAAGPAFEGARIGQGMRAAPGAISRVSLGQDGMPEVGVIDGRRPAIGLCGTGLLDAVAALLAVGVVDPGGRILDPDMARKRNPRVHPGLLSLLHREEDASWSVWLERPAGRGAQGVKLTQKDVRELQLAKSAIAAGVRALLARAGLGPGDVDRVLVAGGFGNYLSPASMLAVGLLPAGIDAGRVRSVGNASLAGARLCLLSREERAEAERVALAAEYVELSGREDFAAAFAEEMLFPAGGGEEMI